MSNPLVSISCITYNHAPYIRQCLDGFLMQECDFEYEILIHDDASTDGTSDIIREYQEKYPEIIKPIIQTENQWSQGVRGIMAKFNFSRAKGKYIALCEGDDYWTDPLKLQKQVDFLEENPEYSLCCHTYTIIRDINNCNNKKGEEQKNNYLTKKTRITLEDYLKKKTIKTLTVVFKSEYVNEKYFNYNFLKKISSTSGDWLLFHKLLLFGDCYIFSEDMGTYRIHTGGISQKKSSTYLRNSLICLINTFHFSLKYKNKKVSKRMKKILFKKISSSMYLSLKKGKNLDFIIFYTRVVAKYFLKII